MMQQNVPKSPALLESAEFPDEWEARIRDFERAWLAGDRPDLSEFLSADPIACRAILPHLIHAELEFRIKQKEPARVEEYLQRFPELLNDDAVVLQFLQAEFQLRRRFEPLLSLNEYERRFPQWRDSLRTWLLSSDHDPLHTQIYQEGSDTHDSDSAQSERELLPEIGSSEWSDFEIRDELGRGGMGVVHLAWQRSLERLVAVKTLHPFVVRSEDILKRFRQEAIAAAQLHHPHIVQVMAFGEISGTPFYVMEYVTGGNLAQRLDGQPWSAVESARLIETLARAAHVAHQRQLLHRDLKPSNILMTSEDSPKISDFGLAKRLDQDSGHTSFGALLGTPSYMSPEQACGTSKELTPATDIYSLGAILYEFLTGRPPIIGTDATAMLEALRLTPPVAPRSLAPKTPRNLETICLKCLQRLPQDRYATAEELAEDLQRFLEGRSILAKRPTTWTKLRLWCHRQPLLSGLSLVLLLLLTILIAVANQARISNQKTLEAQTRLQDTRKIFLNAHNAVRSMYGEVPSQSELIRSRQYYSAFLNAHLNDPELRLECAISRYSLGKLSYLEKDSDAAVQWLQAADQAFDQLGEQRIRQDGVSLLWFMRTQLDLAEECHRRKDDQAARDSYEKLQGLLERCLQMTPDSVQLQHRLAFCKNNQYRVAGTALDAKVVLQRCESARDTWRHFVDSKTPFPNEIHERTSSFHGHLSAGFRNCGKVLLILERYPEAISQFQELFTLEKYCREHPEELATTGDLQRIDEFWRGRVLDAHDGVAKSHYMWGKRRLNDAQPDLAVENFLKSIQHWTVVVESGEATESQRMFQASSHFHLAIAHRRQGHRPEALTEYQRAVALWEPMLADANRKGFNRELAKSHLDESRVEIKKIQEQLAATR